MAKKLAAVTTAIFTAALIHVASFASETSHRNKNDAETLELELFIEVKGMLHGLAFDDRGDMFVGRNGKEILQISSEGAISIFAVIAEAEGRFIEGHGHTFLYDMAFGNDGNLYVAAEDRILRIAPDGKISIMLQQDFSGHWGACGIALDKNDNVYFSYDNKIMRIQPNGNASLIIDGDDSQSQLFAAVGLTFDTACRYLYICDGEAHKSKVLRVPVHADGTVGKPECLFKSSLINLEYIAKDEGGNLYVKGPWSNDFIKIDTDLTPVRLKGGAEGFQIQTIAFGYKGDQNKCLYGTHMYGKIYKIKPTR